MHIGHYDLSNTVKRRASPRLICGCALLLGLAAVARPAAAGTLPVPATFGQFHQTSSGADANNFSYLNHFGGTGDSQLVTLPSGGSPGGPISVVFNYLTIGGSLPADLQGNQDATLRLTSSTKDAVVIFGGVIGDQQILGNGDLPNVLTITRNTPAAEGLGTRTILLQMTFTAQLLGALNSNPQLSGDTSIGYTVNYSSDFITFPGSQHSFSLTFSSWTPGLTKANDFYAAATAAGAGTFASNTFSTPEPGTFALLSFGALTLAIPAWRRRRRKGIIPIRAKNDPAVS
jgi:hypothetical protein